MKYTLQYCKIKSLSRKEVAIINQVQLFKQILISCELVRITGRGTTECFK